MSKTPVIGLVISGLKNIDALTGSGRPILSTMRAVGIGSSAAYVP